MTARLIESDPLRGVSTWFHFNPMTKETTIETRQDCEPILEANKRDALSGTDGWAPDRQSRRVASIPVVLLECWSKKYGVSMADPAFNEIIRRKLNDKDWQFLRTSTGRV
jgi:hypothetical protein